MEDIVKDITDANKEASLNQVTVKLNTSNTPTAIDIDRGFYKMATLLVTSELVPKNLRDAASVFLVIKTAQVHGIDYLLALQNAYVIQGKLSFSSHFLWARAVQNPDCVYHEVFSDEKSARATIKRRMQNNVTVTFTKTFTLEDAKKAGITNTAPWRSYPTQMLEARAKCYCVRNAFPDFMTGIYAKEELQQEPVIINKEDGNNNE